MLKFLLHPENYQIFSYILFWFLSNFFFQTLDLLLGCSNEARVETELFPRWVADPSVAYNHQLLLVVSFHSCCPIRLPQMTGS